MQNIDTLSQIISKLKRITTKICDKYEIIALSNNFNFQSSRGIFIQLIYTQISIKISV